MRRARVACAGSFGRAAPSSARCRCSRMQAAGSIWVSGGSGGGGSVILKFVPGMKWAASTARPRPRPGPPRRRDFLPQRRQRRQPEKPPLQAMWSPRRRCRRRSKASSSADGVVDRHAEDRWRATWRRPAAPRRGCPPRRQPGSCAAVWPPPPARANQARSRSPSSCSSSSSASPASAMQLGKP